jgi:hypothetical protein
VWDKQKSDAGLDYSFECIGLAARIPQDGADQVRLNRRRLPIQLFF